MSPSYEQDPQQKPVCRWWWSQCQHGRAIAESLEAASEGDPIHRQQDQGGIWQRYDADHGGQEGKRVLRVILPMVLQIRETMVLQRVELEEEVKTPHFWVFGP
jgi:hypothetical protein